MRQPCQRECRRARRCHASAVSMRVPLMSSRRGLRRGRAHIPHTVLLSRSVLSRPRTTLLSRAALTPHSRVGLLKGALSESLSQYPRA